MLLSLKHRTASGSPPGCGTRGCRRQAWGPPPRFPRTHPSPGGSGAAAFWDPPDRPAPRASSAGLCGLLQVAARAPLCKNTPRPRQEPQGKGRATWPGGADSRPPP